MEFEGEFPNKERTWVMEWLSYEMTELWNDWVMEWLGGRPGKTNKQTYKETSKWDDSNVATPLARTKSLHGPDNCLEVSRDRETINKKLPGISPASWKGYHSPVMAKRVPLEDFEEGGGTLGFPF